MNNKFLSVIDLMRTGAFTLFLCVTFILMADSGLSGRWHDFLFWIKPALTYCFFTGLITFALLLIIFLIFKKRIIGHTDKLISYLKKHNVTCVLIMGILFAVFLNFLQVGLNITLWFLSIFPVQALLIAFPIFLATRLRNKFLVGRIKLLLLTAFFISASVSILLFVLAVNTGMVVEPSILFAPEHRLGEINIRSYPYDCLVYMCNGIPYFGTEIILALAAVLLGNSIKKIHKYISHKRKKRNDSTLGNYKL